MLSGFPKEWITTLLSIYNRFICSMVFGFFLLFILPILVNTVTKVLALEYVCIPLNVIYKGCQHLVYLENSESILKPKVPMVFPIFGFSTLNFCVLSFFSCSFVYLETCVGSVNHLDSDPY